jgi:hypothetical protein
MITERLEHSGSSGPTTLAAEIAPAATTFTVVDATGFPTGAVGKFVVTLQRGTLDEERMLCSSRSGPSITVDQRGWDGTIARTHSAGATVEHTWSATEADQANDHTSSAGDVHGVVGDVVGTTDAQTLSNKTLTAPTIADFTNAAHDHGDVNDGGNIPQASVTSLVADLGAITSDISVSQGNIATNTADIATNVADIAARQLLSEKGQANGYASLDGSAEVPFAQLPTGTGGSVVAVGNHTHDIDGIVEVNPLTERTLTAEADPKVLASINLGVGVWLIQAMCNGATLGNATNTRWFYNLGKTGGTSTLRGGTKITVQSERTATQGGVSLWGVLTVTAGPTTIEFQADKLGTGANITTDTNGSLVAIPLHGI